MSSSPSADEQFAGNPLRFLAAIVESSDDAIIGKTLDGTITSWNGGAERIYGYGAEEMIGRPIATLAPADAPDEIPTILARLRRGERIDHFETRRRTKDGRIINVSVTISPIKGDGDEIVGASAIARDITERVRAARVERLALELSAANKALRDFIAMAAHDLRTPITVIKGFAGALSERWDMVDDRQKQDYVAVVTRQAGRLSRLVDDLLMVARIQSHALPVERQVIETTQVVQEVMQDLGPEGQGVAVAVEPQTALKADVEHVRRILHNYISNAIRYGAPPIEVRASKRDEVVELRVSDRGEGVPGHFVPRLFEKFERADKTKSQHMGGTGLGLAIVKGLAEANAGEAWYEPNRPTGSVFAVRLPAA